MSGFVQGLKMAKTGIAEALKTLPEAKKEFQERTTGSDPWDTQS